MLDIVLYVKTLIKVFFLDRNVKACMIEHAFLGRFWEEITCTVLVKAPIFMVLDVIYYANYYYVVVIVIKITIYS